MKMIKWRNLMRNFKRLLVVGTIMTMMMAFIFVLTNSANAVKTTAADKTTQAPEQRVPGAFLTGPNAGEPLDIALNYIQQNVDSLGLTAADISDLAVSDLYMSQHNGVTHIYLQQRLNEIPVHNALLNINIASDGSVINLGSRLVADLANSVVSNEAAISQAQAVQSVAGELGLTTAGSEARSRSMKCQPTAPSRSMSRLIGRLSSGCCGGVASTRNRWPGSVRSWSMWTER
jgi:Zn-dependent metalloprotease